MSERLKLPGKRVKFLNGNTAKHWTEMSCTKKTKKWLWNYKNSKGSSKNCTVPNAKIVTKKSQDANDLIFEFKNS